MKRRYVAITLAAFLLLLIIPLFAGLTDGVKTVTAAGTAEPLAATSTECISVVVQALVDNTGNVFIGASTIEDGRGIELEPGDSLTFAGVNNRNLYDLVNIYVDAETNGEGVGYTCFAR